jgi:hypothetical protein
MFVDLVKAFDTVNHDLIFKLLLKFGIPVELMDVIKWIGKETLDIEYITGVHQGDNVVPVLFLFLMLADSSTLKRCGLSKPHNSGTSPFRDSLRSDNDANT